MGLFHDLMEYIYIIYRNHYGALRISLNGNDHFLFREPPTVHSVLQNRSMAHFQIRNHCRLAIVTMIGMLLSHSLLQIRATNHCQSRHDDVSAILRCSV